MAVLLIDCQGTGDVKYGSSSLDNITSFISLQLSDVLVINLMRQFDIGALTRLKVSHHIVKVNRLQFTKTLLAAMMAQAIV